LDLSERKVRVLLRREEVLVRVIEGTVEGEVVFVGEMGEEAGLEFEEVELRELERVVVVEERVSARRKRSLSAIVKGWLWFGLGGLC